MPGRILTMQRELREVGRLRTGYTANNRPVRSKTWILTSKDRDLLVAAAEEWGGQVVEWTPLNRTDKQWSLTTETATLPAQLPPGDPLSQANELWSGGGAQRRCNGITESKTDRPCLCVAQFGGDWHLQDKKVRCQPYSHLNLMLLNLPDVGRWRHTTKSFYAAGEIAGMVDLIKARVGPEPIVPVWLIIDQREKIADGKKTPYPVPIIKVRGAESGAALLSGNVPTLELGPARERIAIGSAGDRDAPAQPQPVAGREQPLTADRALKDIASARNQKQLDALKGDFRAAGLRDQAVIDAWSARSVEIAKSTSAPPDLTAPPAEVVEPDDDPEPDKTAVWMQALALVGAAPHRWNTEQLEAATVEYCGKPSAACNGWELSNFLDSLKKGLVPA